MEMALWTSLLLGLWATFIAVGAWVLVRMNLQVRRLRDSPTPRQAFDVLKDMQEAHDLKLAALTRQSEHNLNVIEDLGLRHRSLVARMNSENRKNDQLDAHALADYLQKVQEDSGEAPQAAPSSFDQTAGEEIDYR